MIMLKRYNNHLYIALFFIVFLLQSYFYFWNIGHFTWLNQLHTDIMYQVERFLIYANFPGIERIHSVDVDYGPELFWYIPFLKAYFFITGQYKAIFAYRLITFIHIMISLLSIGLLLRGLKNRPLLALAFLLALFLSPYFSFNMAFIKPDTSWVLLFTILAITHINKIKISFNAVLLSSLYIGLGFGTKWWTIFTLPSFIYLLIKNLDQYREKIRKIAPYIYLPLIIIMPLITYKILGELSFLLGKRHIANELQKVLSDQNNQIIFSFSIFTFFSFYYLIFIFLQKTKRLNPLLKDGGLSLHFASSLTFLTYILYSLPYILSGFFTKSLSYWLVFVFKIDEFNTPSNRIGSTLSMWIHEIFLYKYLSPLFLICFLFTIIFFFYKKNKLSSEHALYSQFLITIVTFLFLFVPRNNIITLAMLMPIWLLLFLEVWDKSFTFKYNRLLLYAILAQLIVFQNQGVYGTIYQMYSSRRLLGDDLYKINDEFARYIPQDQSFYMCDRDFPFIPENRPVKYLGRQECFKHLQEFVLSSKLRPLIINDIFLQRFGGVKWKESEKPVYINYKNYHYVLFLKK